MHELPSHLSCLVAALDLLVSGGGMDREYVGNLGGKR